MRLKTLLELVGILVLAMGGGGYVTSILTILHASAEWESIDPPTHRTGDRPCLYEREDVLHRNTAEPALGVFVRGSVFFACQATSIDISTNDAKSFGCYGNPVDCDSLIITFQPLYGTVANNGTCWLTYTPDPGVWGVRDYFAVVGDCLGTGTSLPLWVFVDVGARPVAVPDISDTCEETPVSIDVIENDYDADGWIYCQSIEIISAPSYGVVDINGCTIIYTPNPGFFGTDFFQYRMSDNEGCVSNPASVALVVNDCG